MILQKPPFDQLSIVGFRTIRCRQGTTERRPMGRRVLLGSASRPVFFATLKTQNLYSFTKMSNFISPLNLETRETFY